MSLQERGDQLVVGFHYDRALQQFGRLALLRRIAHGDDSAAPRNEGVHRLRFFGVRLVREE